MSKTETPMTVYGLIARKYNTDPNYVGEVVRKFKNRKAKRGRAAAILADWNRIQASLDDWMSETLSDGTMRFVMPKGTTVYVQRGIARVYLGGDLKNETSVEMMTVREFQAFLNDIRLSIN